MSSMNNPGITQIKQFAVISAVVLLFFTIGYYAAKGLVLLLN